MIEAYLGLGSNVGDRAGFLKSAISGLRGHKEIKILALSSIYQTEPVGPITQGKFLNAVVHLKTTLTPQELLEVSLKIEQKCGRVREERWGPRTLDIDIILYGDKGVEEEDLQIPHPSMLERGFVLAPLAEISPDLEVSGSSVVEHLHRLEMEGVERLIDFDRSQSVGIVGASAKPDRYANRAQRMLMDFGHSVVPIAYRDDEILGVPCVRSVGEHKARLDTLTLYLSPSRQKSIIDDLVAANPKRVIFNPGTESDKSERRFASEGIKAEHACTLVLLQTGQFS